jgi:endoglucanase
MDHPAYVQGQFLGGVPSAYLQRKPPTRDFGAFKMWDLPPFELRGDRIFSRACDDLIGCAALVATLQHLERERVEGAIDVAFTCAEEVGLLGSVFLAKSGRIPRNLGVISLETSALRPPAQMGSGVIVRVGDRSSVFDPELTAQLLKTAAEASIPNQRCLMSGGTCEATAFRLYGYRVAGLCVALGNYHNCAENDQIGPEFVSLSDFISLSQLCVELSRPNLHEDPDSLLRERLENELIAHITQWRPHLCSRESEKKD